MLIFNMDRSLLEKRRQRYCFAILTLRVAKATISRSEDMVSLVALKGYGFDGAGKIPVRRKDIERVKMQSRTMRRVCGVGL
jgi:hypothetical protein